MVREFRRLKEPFGPVWSGPFEIANKESDLVYVVLRDSRPVKLHVKDLRPAPGGNDAPQYNSEDSDSSSTNEEPTDKDLSPNHIVSQGTSHSSDKPQLLESTEVLSHSDELLIHSSNPFSSLQSQTSSYSSDEESTNLGPQSHTVTETHVIPRHHPNTDPTFDNLLEIPYSLRRQLNPKRCTLPCCK